MSKTGNFIIGLAEQAEELLSSGLNPEYLDMEMKGILTPDEFGFYEAHKDVVMETLMILTSDDE